MPDIWQFWRGNRDLGGYTLDWSIFPSLPLFWACQWTTVDCKPKRVFLVHLLLLLLDLFEVFTNTKFAVRRLDFPDKLSHHHKMDANNDHNTFFNVYSRCKWEPFLGGQTELSLVYWDYTLLFLFFCFVLFFVVFLAFKAKAVNSNKTENHKSGKFTQSVWPEHGQLSFHTVQLHAAHVKLVDIKHPPCKSTVTFKQL